ncbi:MAG: response regulator [Gammaproteobacteria bacterium]
MRILLVEDDSLIGEGLRSGLQGESHSVDWVMNGESALTAIRKTSYDAVILDIGLPGINGLEVLKKVRSQGYIFPVLILTAQDGVTDRVSGLDTGADDYLSKPFEFDELCARLRALVRRSQGLPDQKIRHQNIVLDPAAHTVTRDNQSVDLSRREFALLKELLSNCGRVLSRSQLEDKLYSWGDEVESNTIEVHIHHLRKRLGSDLIKTVRGVGYIIARN